MGVAAFQARSPPNKEVEGGGSLPPPTPRRISPLAWPRERLHPQGFLGSSMRTGLGGRLEEGKRKATFTPAPRSSGGPVPRLL